VTLSTAPVSAIRRNHTGPSLTLPLSYLSYRNGEGLQFDSFLELASDARSIATEEIVQSFGQELGSEISGRGMIEEEGKTNETKRRERQQTLTVLSSYGVCPW